MTRPPFVLQVLGSPALHGPDGEAVTFRTKKHFALLIYLALEPQLHRREKLGALLWPGATTSEARHSLATGLSVLRGKLGREYLETGRDTARLLPGCLEIDLDRLARGEIHSTETSEALAVAPLLHDFVVADAEPWDLWREGLAAKWQPAIRDALLSRIDRSRRQGNTRAMEVLADALLQLDDLSEDGVRAKMESRAFAGDRLTALQIYESWRVRLADELGAQPSELVAGMALRLRRRGWERTSGEHIPSVRTDQWKDRPFVGRGKEYEVLYEGWEGCQRGAARHVLITGESGVGKSTLVERLTTAAGLQGAVTARVQCHEVEKEIPYGAIGGLIGQLLELQGATAVAPEWLSELSRTASVVRRRFPNVATPPEATGETVRIRLTDALHELVRAIAEEQPLILVLDDIHLGDDASVAVTHMLLRRLTDESVLVVGMLRLGDGGLAPSARGMIDRAELAGLTVVALPPLNEGESVELLGRLLPDDRPAPPATVRRALLKAGGGLPMLLELLVRDWLSHGDRCVALAVEAMTEEPGAEGGAGNTYQRLLERLTVGIDPNTRGVLNLAAILGSQLNEFELYSLVDLTLAQAMAGLSQLATLRILRDSGHGLEFVNEVMRGQVYLSVPSSVRKVLHSKVADRLIARSQGGEEMLGLAIAWHCVRSGRVQEAGKWLVRGGHEAIARSALAEAEAALESGHRHLSGPHRAECGVLLGEVLFDQERYEAAAELVRQLGKESAQSPSLTDLESLSEIATTSNDYLGASPALDRLWELARSTEREPTRLRAAQLSVALATRSLDDHHLAPALRTVLAVRDAVGPHLHPRLALLHAQVLFGMRDIDETERLLQSQNVGPQNGPGLFRYHLHVGITACRIARGDYAGALHPALRAIELAVQAGSPYPEMTAASNLALVHYRLGQSAHAHQAAARSLQVQCDTRFSAARATAFGVLLCTLASEMDRTAFVSHLSAAMEHAARAPHGASMGLARLWIADALWVTGQRDDALTFADETLRAISTTLTRYMGLVARWAALTSIHRNRHSYHSLIHNALANQARLDALDRAEVACAGLAVLALTEEHENMLAQTAASTVARLPETALLNLGIQGLKPPHLA
jgi:DNA-binding SARP family transcriptional activator/tetratricopeptide (TPR) repeat protein